MNNQFSIKELLIIQKGLLHLIAQHIIEHKIEVETTVTCEEALVAADIDEKIQKLLDSQIRNN